MPIKWPIGKCHAPPKNFGNVQNSGGAWHSLSLTSLSDNGRFDGWLASSNHKLSDRKP